MKKILIYSLILLIVAIISVSGTYAFFYAFVSDLNAFNLNAHQINVNYSGDVIIDGEIELVRTKEKGFKRRLSIGLGEESVEVVGNLFIHISDIAEGLASSISLKWELYEVKNSTETYISSGTFQNTVPESRIYMLQNIELTTEEKNYAIYIWMNGDEAGNEVRDGYLIGYIGAESNKVSGITS